MTYSRRVKRLPAGWEGSCRLEGELVDRRCRIDDISMLGLGVTFTHPSPSELAGRGIAVDVPGVAQLEGTITHVEPVLGGVVRAGVVFNDGTATAGEQADSKQTMVDHSGR